MMTTSSAVNSDHWNNSWTMADLNPAGGAQRSGTTTITLPKGAVVTRAYLEWSANRALSTADGGSASATDPWTGALTAARIKTGDGSYGTVEASSIDSLQRDGREYYVARADVTALVKARGAGEYSVADIAVAQTRNDSDPTYYGGFTLTVIYEDPSVAATTRVALFEGPHWVSANTPVEIRFPTAGAATVAPAWTAFEGDRGNHGDQLSIDGSAFAPLREAGRGTGTTADAADSTAFGSPWVNTLGVDAKPFAPRDVKPGLHTLRVLTNGDNFLIGTLAVTISDAE